MNKRCWLTLIHWKVLLSLVLRFLKSLLGDFLLMWRWNQMKSSYDILAFLTIFFLSHFLNQLKIKIKFWGQFEICAPKFQNFANRFIDKTKQKKNDQNSIKTFLRIARFFLTFLSPWPPQISLKSTLKHQSASWPWQEFFKVNNSQRHIKFFVLIETKPNFSPLFLYFRY